MKLLTVNCHAWIEENQLEKIRILANTIKENDYDVIALQEVSQSIAAPAVDGSLKEDNYLLVLLKYLEENGVTHYQYLWDFVHIGFDIYEEGVAILTKHPIVEETSFFISKNKDTSFWKTRKVVGAKIRFDEKEMWFYSCHLGWWNDEEESFQDQVSALLNEIDPSERFYLMGDFNNSGFKRNEGYDYLLEQGLVDTYNLAEAKDSGVTVLGKIAGWDENLEEMRLDLILTNSPLRVISSNVIFNGNNKPVISDHYGVEVEVE